MDLNLVNTHDSKERGEHEEEKFYYEDVPDLITDVKQEVLEEEAPHCTIIQNSPRDSEAKHNGLLSEQDGILIKTEGKEELNDGKNLCEEFEGPKIKDEELDEKGDMEQDDTRHNGFLSEQDGILINTGVKEELDDCKNLCEVFEGSEIKDEELDIKEGDMEQNQTSMSSDTLDQRNMERNAAQQFSDQTGEVICDNETNLKKRNDKVNMHMCNQCGYQTIYKYTLTCHLRIHKNREEARVFKCDQCDYQSIWKSALKSHGRQHKKPEEIETFKCDKCNYQTIRKLLIARHLCEPKDPSEASIKDKGPSEASIKDKDPSEAFIKDKDPSEASIEDKDPSRASIKDKKPDTSSNPCGKKNMEPDATQQFSGRAWKENLKNRLKKCIKTRAHRRLHKNPQGEVISVKETNLKEKNVKVNIYKCDQCDYRTFNKYVFRNHVRTHKNREEADTFKCANCDYQSIWKSALISHCLQHRNPEEVGTFKCNKCNYQTIRRQNLKIHSVRHKDPSEAVMFKCNQCDFQTKYETSLRKHLIQHKRPEDVERFKCDLCDFQTIHKRNLGSHRKLHKYFHRNPQDEVICDNETNIEKKNDQGDVYKCDQCDYQTAFKYVLQNHLRIHKNSEEPSTFKCDQCDFQSIWKNSLRVHRIQHKNPEEVEIFKCDQCNYQTIRRNLIIRHLSVYKDHSNKKKLKQPSIKGKQPK